MSVTSSAIIPNPWVRILDALEKKINRHSYDTWLKPTRYSHASNGILFVRVPTAEFTHVSDKYADLIQEAIDNLGLDYKDVKFVTPEDDPSNTPIRHNGGLSLHSSGGQTPSGGPHPTQARFDWDSAAQLNQRYTFDAFVIGSGNQLAFGRQFSHHRVHGGVQRLLNFFLHLLHDARPLELFQQLTGFFEAPDELLLEGTHRSTGQDEEASPGGYEEEGRDHVTAHGEGIRIEVGNQDHEENAQDRSQHGLAFPQKVGCGQDR